MPLAIRSGAWALRHTHKNLDDTSIFINMDVPREKGRHAILCPAHDHCPAGQKTSVLRRRHIQMAPGSDFCGGSETQPTRDCIWQEQLSTSGAVVFKGVDVDHDHALSPRKKTCCARTKSLPSQPRALLNAGIEQGFRVTTHPPHAKLLLSLSLGVANSPVTARGPVGHVEAIRASLRIEPNTIEVYQWV